MSERINSVDDLAKALGIAKSTIYRWRADGWGIDDLFNEAAGGWDVNEVRRWQEEMKRARRKILRPSLDSEEDLEDSEAEQDWGNVYRRAKAVMATLQARRLQESLVERVDMERGFAGRVAEVSASLDVLANMLPPRLAPLTRESEIQAVLREAFREIRDHFAR